MLRPEFIAFLTFAFTAAVTPGPSNVLVMTAGAQAGMLGGMRCLFGVVAGMALMMGAAVAGLGGIIDAYPALLTWLKWTGTAFLLWLSWKIFLTKPTNQEGLQPVVGFWKALAFQWVNPKSWVVSASAAATYGGVMPGSSMARALTISAGFAAAATVACTIWLIFGAALKKWMTNPRNASVFNRSMGLLLAASTVFIHL